MANLLQSEHLGRTEFYIWWGMVVGGSEWEDNQKDESISKHKIHSRDDISGWGYRAKVAILGYDPRLVKENTIKNSELVMAEVMLPVTGGGGIGGGVQTPSIGNNSFVVGFYKDGVSAREPIIMGVLPNVAQSRLDEYNKPETVRYDASSGYKDGKQPGPADPVANDALWLEGGDGGTPIQEAAEAVRPSTLMLKAQLDDGKRVFPMPQTLNCQKKNGPLEGVQIVLQELSKVIGLSKAAKGIEKASDALKNANAMITTATNVISSYTRGMMQDMRTEVLNQVNRVTQTVLDIFPPNLRPATSNGKTNPILDSVTCAFNKALGSTRGLIGSFLNDFVGGAVNTALGAVSALGGVLTGTLGGVLGSVSGALGGLSSLADSAAGLLSDPVGALGGAAAGLLGGGGIGGAVGGLLGGGGIGGAVGGIASKAFGALDVVFGALNLFSCKEELGCGKVNASSALSGEEPFGNILKSAKSSIKDLASIPDQLLNAVDQATGIVEGAVSDLAGIPGQSLSNLENDLSSELLSLTGLNIDVSLTTEEFDDSSANKSSLSTSKLNDLIQKNASSRKTDIFGIDNTNLAADSQNNTNNEQVKQEEIRQSAKANSGPILSGPPQISSSGGGKAPVESIGNPVISPSGELLAIDLNPNVGGFTNPPSVIVSDSSGQGRGADVITLLESGDGEKFDIEGCGNPDVQPTYPNINENLLPFTGKVVPDLNSEDNETELIGGGQKQNPPLSPLTPSLIPVEKPTPPTGRKIDKFIIRDSGVGYLPKPDGSSGFAGQVFSNPEDTIVFCGGYNVFPPCGNVTVEKGSIVYIPLGTEGTIFDSVSGDVVQSFIGRGPTNGIEVLESGVLATPCVTREEVIPPPPTNNFSSVNTNIPQSGGEPNIPQSGGEPNTYDVALEIGDIYIDDPGINYSPDDVIVLEPSNGAELEPKYDEDGRLLEVKIINPGIGFTEFPVVKIPSTTGVRAKIVPIFNIIRIDNTQTEQTPVPQGVDLISVVDCVGIIPPKREFDIVPQ